MTCVIETDRLILRPFRQDDLPHIQRYATRSAFYRYITIEEQTPHTVAAFFEKRMAEQEVDDRTHRTFAVEFKDVGHIVGAVSFSVAKGDDRSGSLGYSLDSDYQGRGLMTEAVHAVLTYGFTTLGIHRIWATADVENTASWRLMERVGMQREGLLRHDKNVRGRWRDSYIYAVLEPEYRH